MPVATQKLVAAPAEPASDQAQRAYLVLVHAHDAATALLKAFDDSRKARRATGGNTTNAEQDLLRAMVVFAGAGLDATIKRLIEDSLGQLVLKSESARDALQTFATRRLRDEAVRSTGGTKGPTLLAAALTSASPQTTIVQAYVDDLLSGSLQSVARLFEALDALGLQGAIPVEQKYMQSVFNDRNEIVHEMDMDFDDPHRKRRSRRKDPMVKASNALLKFGDSLIVAVDEALTK